LSAIPPSIRHGTRVALAQLDQHVQEVAHMFKLTHLDVLTALDMIVSHSFRASI
jgi:ABC-type proline/glycine betaine transport system permease subunit